MSLPPWIQPVIPTPQLGQPTLLQSPPRLYLKTASRRVESRSYAYPLFYRCGLVLTHWFQDPNHGDADSNEERLGATVYGLGFFFFRMAFTVVNCHNSPARTRPCRCRRASWSFERYMAEPSTISTAILRNIGTFYYQITARERPD